MLLAGCSTVCTTVAEAAKMWHLVVVSIIKLFFRILRTNESEFFQHFLVMLRRVVASLVRSK